MGPGGLYDCRNNLTALYSIDRWPHCLSGVATAQTTTPTYVDGALARRTGAPVNQRNLHLKSGSQTVREHSDIVMFE